MPSPRRVPFLILVLLAFTLPQCVRKGDPLAPERPDPPVIVSSDPSTVLVGTEATIRVTGSQFRSSTTWRIEGTGVTLVSWTFVSETLTDIKVAVAASAPAGPVTVLAQNPSSEVTSAVLFEVVEPAGPKLLGASPATLLPGSSVTVTFSGENLEPGLTISGPAGVGVSWSASSYVSASEARAVATVDATAAPGPRDVTVTNPGGKRGTSAGIVAVGSAADPAVFSVSPASAPQGSSGVAVQVRGANFVAGSTLSVGGSGVSVRSASFVNPGRIDAALDISASAAIAAYDVTVTLPSGKSATGRRAFSVTAPAVRLSTDVQPILSASCGFAGCHGGASPTLGMNLGSAATTLATAVGVTSTEVPSLRRIAPGNVAGSYLVNKIEGTQSVGARMPLGAPALGAAQIKLIKDWIAQGAKNN